MNKVRGSLFVMGIVGLLVLGVMVFLLAARWPVSHEHVRSVATALFAKGVQSVGASVSDFKGPQGSGDSENETIQFCWESLTTANGIKKICIIYEKYNAQYSVFKVMNNSRYERLPV